MKQVDLATLLGQGHTHPGANGGALPKPEPDAGAGANASPKPEGTANMAPLFMPTRPPCMWMLLQPLRQDGQDFVPDEARPPLILPLHIDVALPGYVVRPDVFEERMNTQWQPGMRVRMQVGVSKVSQEVASFHSLTD